MLLGSIVMIINLLIYIVLGYLVFLLLKTLPRLIKALDIYISKNS